MNHTIRENWIKCLVCGKMIKRNKDTMSWHAEFWHDGHAEWHKTEGSIGMLAEKVLQSLRANPCPLSTGEIRHAVGYPAFSSLYTALKTLIDRKKIDVASVRGQKIFNRTYRVRNEAEI